MFWKVYFWFVVFLATMSIPTYMKTLRLWECVDILSSLIALVGLFGLAWQKQFVGPKFWKSFFLFWIIWSPVYLFVIPFTPEMLTAEGVTMSQTTLGSITLIFALPHFMGLYKYAFSNSVFS